MHFRFLQFPRGSQDWSLSDSELERSIPDLALVIQKYNPGMKMLTLGPVFSFFFSVLFWPM